MYRKDYQKPTMRVVKLQHRGHILVGSGELVTGKGNPIMQDYNWNNETQEE